DAIKSKFHDSIIVAVEPKECSTLFNEGMGHHRIEGIGDKMVVLIHNVRNTDYVLQVHDDDTVRGLKVMNAGADVLRRACGSVASGTGSNGSDYSCYSNLFGISSICNIMGAIRTARHLGLGEQDNVVTIATDSF